MQPNRMSGKRSRTSGSRRSRSRALGRFLAGLVAACMMAGASPALADEYDPEVAGHPLRIVAYVLHPVGVLLDYLILRPAHWLASHEPLKTAFGHED